MVLENEGILKLANNIHDSFRFSEKRGVEHNINIAVILAIPNKVVVGFMLELDVAEGVPYHKVIKKRKSFLVLLVDITIATYEQRCIWVLDHKFINANLQISKVRNKFSIFTVSWEINTNMNGYTMIR